MRFWRKQRNRIAEVIGQSARLRMGAALLAIGMLVCARPARAAILYAGTCSPNGYASIQLAVAAAAAGDTVKVCPGTYKEMITIDKKLTLQGISAGRSNPEPTIQYPTSTDRDCTLSADPEVCAQILVQNATATITGLKLDGSNFGFGCFHTPDGIVIFDGSGTVSNNSIINHAKSCSEEGNSPIELGGGVLAGYDTQGNYKVTVSSNYIGAFGVAGVLLDGSLNENIQSILDAVNLTGAISSNTFSANVQNSNAIEVGETNGVSVTGNNITSTGPDSSGDLGALAIAIGQSNKTTVSDNTINTAEAGVDLYEVSSSSVTGNQISGVTEGVVLDCTNTTAIDGNRITDTPPNTAAVGMTLIDCGSSLPPVGSDDNKIEGNRISGFCGGILTGSALNVSNVSAGNTFLLIGPGADLMAGNDCP